MRLPRTFIIAAVIAVAALTLGFGEPLSSLRKDATAPQDIVPTAVTGDVTPLTHGPSPQCPPGGTKEGPFGTLPRFQCANGSSTFLGLSCPPAPAPAPVARQAPPPSVT
jgi:hypothetical protein